MDFGMFGWWVVVGVLAGWLTGFVMKDGGYGLVGDMRLDLVTRHGPTKFTAREGVAYEDPPVARSHSCHRPAMPPKALPRPRSRGLPGAKSERPSHALPSTLLGLRRTP